ncbi:MAG: TIGR04282 family arsenosugar biosynthesis glycosyltransferase [Paracoccaceae bacterium]|nr:TIGR04282 family arsenosugar biosynthesis glycosyltransferase [Paracoccaceae bacterium]
MIFAKAPVLGRVKTRLAADIGDAAALAIYLRMLQGVVARLTQGDWRLRLAVTPDDSAEQGAIWPSDVERLAQGEGDLGTRMLRVLASATPMAPVVVVGSDIPGLGVGQITRAFKALRTRPLVFGPSEDGGFYLAGASQTPPEGLFQGVIWSTATVLRDSIATSRQGSVALIDTLDDLDDVAALARHRAAGRI